MTQQLIAEEQGYQVNSLLEISVMVTLSVVFEPQIRVAALRDDH